MRACLLVPLVLGCQAVPAESRAAAVELRDAGGAVVVRIARTPGGCSIDAPALTATVAGSLVTAGAWQVVDGPTGRELRGPTGLVARVVDQDDQLAVVDPIGVPLARFVIDDAGATIADRARNPIGQLERHDAEIRWLDAGQRVTARVTGSTDVSLAAVLALSTLPIEARALYACGRLTSAPVPAK